MIKLEGIVLNVFAQQGGQNKKGETFDDRDKVQIPWRYGTSQWWCEKRTFHTLSRELPRF